MSSPQKIVHVLIPGICDVTLLENTTFAEVIKMMPCKIRIDPKTNDRYFNKRKEREIWTQTQSEEGHVMMET